MTEQEFKDYYADQLIIQYKTQQKARATVGAVVSQSPASAGVNGKGSYVIVGSPTIVDGVVSNFSQTNLLFIDTAIDTGDVESLEVQIKFTTGAAFNHTFEGILGCVKGTFGFYITQEGVLRGVYLDNKGTHDNPIGSGLQPNTTYYAKMLLGANFAILFLSTDGVVWNETIYSSDDEHEITGDYFMVSTYPFSGSIDLNETYIKINGEAWTGYSTVNVDLPSLIINGYDLETASGKQLDIIGQYIGLKRTVRALIGNSNTNVLSDEQYRVLLRLKLIKNTNFSSTSQLRAALYAWFPMSIRLYDNRDMTYDYQLSSFWSELLNVLVVEELLPVPMALGYTATIVPNLLELYGYSDYGGLNNNPNGYSSYQTGFKGRYLSYGDKFAGDE